MTSSRGDELMGALALVAQRNKNTISVTDCHNADVFHVKHAAFQERVEHCGTRYPQAAHRTYPHYPQRCALMTAGSGYGLSLAAPLDRHRQ